MYVEAVYGCSVGRHLTILALHLSFTGSKSTHVDSSLLGCSWDSANYVSLWAASFWSDSDSGRHQREMGRQS